MLLSVGFLPICLKNKLQSEAARAQVEKSRPYSLLKSSWKCSFELILFIFTVFTAVWKGI